MTRSKLAVANSITEQEQYRKIFDSPVFTPPICEQIDQVVNDQTITELYVDKIIRGVYRHGLLRGAPGLGKSHVVYQALVRANLKANRDFIIVKGHCSPMALYKIMYQYRAPGQFVVLDDCDIEDDLVGLDLIKAATDPDNSRITWASNRIPVVNGQSVSEFLFRGHLILCTNTFEASGYGGRKTQKINAVLSRVRARTVDWSTREKKFAQIVNLVVRADYLNLDPNERPLTDDEKRDLLVFIMENMDEFDAVDLRLPQRIASDIRDGQAGDWREFCRVSLLGGQ